MAFDFPATPTIGDEYTSGGITYVWSGTAWDIQGGGDLQDYVLKTGDAMTGMLDINTGISLGLRLCSTAGVPTMALSASSSTHTGLIEFFDQNGTTRRGYIGYGSATWLDIVAENGAGWKFANKLQLDNGVGFANFAQPAGSEHLVTRHIDLYGGTFGFSISSGTLNHIVPSANKHDFKCGTTRAFSVSNAAIENYSPVNFRAASYAYGAITLISGSHLKVPEGTAIRFHVTDAAISSTDNKAIRYGVAENSWHIFKVGADTEFTINSGGAGLLSLAPAAADLGVAPDSDGTVNIAKAMIAMLAKIKQLETEIATLRK